MSTSLKKYFPAGTPVKWSASAENFFPSSGEIILNDDTTLNIELQHNFSRDYWVVVEANNDATSIERTRFFRVYTKNYNMFFLENLPEIGERFYGVRKSDYPDLQWDYLLYHFNDGTISKPISTSYFKQIQIDFGNQEITGQLFPIRTIKKTESAKEFPYARLDLENLYIYGGDNIQSYNGITYLHIDSLKIFSKVPSDVKFSANEKGGADSSFIDSIYVQNPTGFTTGYQMFSGLGRCSVNIEDFDFSNINDVRYMFNSVYFKDVDSYPLFDTSHITDMSYMFGGTLKTTGLLNNIPLYDTSNVTKMKGMFSGRNIDVVLPNFNTSNVTDMSYMFKKAIINTTLPNMDMSKVTDIYEMFCGATINTALPNWNMSNILSMGSMFEDATINTPLPNWDTSNVTSMGSLFAKSNINVFPNWNMSKVTNTYYMFYNCKKLTEFRMDMSLVTSADNMFKGCTSLSDLYISNLKASTDISDCPLTDDSAHFIFFNLQDVTNKTLKVSSKLKHVDIYADLAKSRGWTVTLV